MNESAKEQLEQMLNQRMLQQARLYTDAIRAFDLIPTEEATSVKRSFPMYSGKKTAHMSFAEYVGLAMAQFNSSEQIIRARIASSTEPKGDEVMQCTYWASAFVSFMDISLTQGYMKQGQGLVKKWEKAELDNQELKAKVIDWEKKYTDCFEHANALEIELGEIRKAEDAQRAADIRDSMRNGRNQSQVGENASEGEKKE